jgi:hypothetical protein
LTQNRVHSGQGLHFLPSFNARENDMPHPTNALLIVSSAGLGLSLFMAVRAFIESRREQAAHFRHYFKSKYGQSQLPQSSLNDDDTNLCDGRSRFRAVNVRDPSAAQYSRGTGAIRWSHDRD